MLNLITVCTDVYPMYYARKIHRRFNEMTNFEVKNWCITDRPDQIKDLAEPIEPPFKGRGWWNKMKVYDSFYEGNALYLDIDNVLIRNFDDEINVALSALDNEKCKIACVSDAIGFHHNHFSSSMMVLKSGNMQKIWDDFELEVQVSYDNFEYEGGDQVYTGHRLKEWINAGYEIYWMDEFHRKLKLNLKYHLGEYVGKGWNQGGAWSFKTVLPNDCKIVDCGGEPKPTELLHLPYIQRCWMEA